MCGIAGILALGDGPRPSRDSLAGRLRRMAQVQVHRGPDGEGLWIAPDESIGLAHRRLAVIDLSPAAAQPMCVEDADLAVVFNGEIYNHLALRRELESRGARFKTDHADTEVLLHGYAAWGLTGLLEKLDGMFAFALWDGRARQLHLVRDRFGVKPLYYAADGRTLRFASEAKAILADLEERPVLDRGAFRLYLTFLAAPAPLTLFRGIFKLPAGHFLTVAADGECRATRWWDLYRQGAAAQSAPGDDADRVRARLQQAVVKRLIGDVPCGVFLSGGVDSSAIAHFAARAASGPIDSFTVGFDVPTPLDETQLARECATRLGLRHHETRIGERDVVPLLRTAVHHQDEPLADWVCLPVLAVSRLAAQHGLKVVLAGEGADELFCGYPGYLAYERFETRYGRPLRKLPRSAALLAAEVLSALSLVSDRAAALQRPIRSAADDEPVFQGGAIGLADDELTTLLDLPPVDAHVAVPGFGRIGWRRPAETIEGILQRLAEDQPAADYLTGLTYTEFKQRLPELLLMRLDKMAMAHGVEVREPYLDRDLTADVLALPTDRRVAGHEPKGLLKQALRGVIPDAVLDSPKRGFGVPIADWLRGSLGEQLRDLVHGSRLVEDRVVDGPRLGRLFEEHRAGRRDRSVAAWAAANAALWYEHWQVRA